MADSRLMHRNIIVRCCKVMLNGKNRPEGVICTQIRQRPLSPIMRTIRIDGNHRNAVDL